jgi:hypothetical protein
MATGVFHYVVPASNALWQLFHVRNNYFICVTIIRNYSNKGSPIKFNQQVIVGTFQVIPANYFACSTIMIIC